MAKLQFENFTLPSYPSSGAIYTNWSDTAYRTIAYNAGRFYQEAFFAFLVEMMFALKSQGLDLNGSEELYSVLFNLRSDVNGIYDEAQTQTTYFYTMKEKLVNLHADLDSLEPLLEELVDSTLGYLISYIDSLTNQLRQEIFERIYRRV
jgi:hypothetical protein